MSFELSIEHVDFKSFSNSRFLYIEGYLATSPPARHAVSVLRTKAREQQTQIALSLSDPAMVLYARDGLVELLGHGVDILFCNQDEAFAFTNRTTVEEALTALHEYSPLVIITQSAQGATIGDCRGLGNDIISAPAFHVDDVVDTNGAGDAYAGCFLYGLSLGLSLHQCAKLAARVSAQVVQQYGPRLPMGEYAALFAAI